MSNIKYIKGDILKKVVYPRIIVHSCNCEGSWGGGIAYQLGCHFPNAEKVYVDVCKKYGTKLLGKCFLIPSDENKNLVICCLFTSSFGGLSHGQGQSILKNTQLALNQLQAIIHHKEGSNRNDIDQQLLLKMKTLERPSQDYKLEMPKINSGIFGVPWEETEHVLQQYGKGDDALSFNVYTL